MKSLQKLINESDRFGLGESLEMTYVYDYVNQNSALAYKLSYEVSFLLEQHIERKVRLGVINHVKRCLDIPEFD